MLQLFPFHCFQLVASVDNVVSLTHTGVFCFPSNLPVFTFIVIVVLITSFVLPFDFTLSFLIELPSFDLLIFANFIFFSFS